MKIDKAAELFIRDIDLWLKDYRQNHSENPKDWPLTGFSIHEWLEDFLQWQSNKGLDDKDEV